ncbi:unnamed protein product [Zymoseptoria tritici ST99CH_1A5]|uniref:L-type lectin-like domain-containing protein n=2 Tax=Zymoseptoria tritici TaxID=1047171 RepID=A0A2H1GLM6_ZYMTR|nr:unnamed protein product [Zymoseptoria tritici ST99CH_1E4]SMY25558.1 unnamed protein product [Zymoseptoria tritici ST99CH_1A5]
MTPRHSFRSLSTLLLATLASAQDTIDVLSFGHKNPLAVDGKKIPGYKSQAVNHEIRVLSDRITLTPPYPGNAKGALWSDAKTHSSDWTATLEFRASGQEVGSGNLQLWYTKDPTQVETHSVYNVEKFDGLVLVVDQYGGTGGKIRGFLNDGSQNYRGQSALESLAFGHCDYHYRNLGRPSKLTVSSSQSGLDVKIDDKTCFSTATVALPEGYHFGITASTGESNPDSIEIYKFLVNSKLSQHEQKMKNPPAQAGDKKPTPGTTPRKMDAFPGIVELIPDREAKEFKSQTEQFSDLHDRLQAMSHHIAYVFGEIKTLAESSETQHKESLAKNTEVLDAVKNMKGSKETGLPPDTIRQIRELSEKVDKLEASMALVSKSLDDDHFGKLFKQIEMMHFDVMPAQMKHALQTHTPSLGKLALLLVGTQVVLAAAYVVYKRRKNSTPKKFL